MVHAHAALPRFQVDAKRIAATSGVIALHVGVLMMLMMPMSPAQTDAEVSEDPIWVDIKPLAPPPPPPPPPTNTRQTHAAATPTSIPVAIPEPQVEPVDQSVGALDTQAVDTGPPDTFEAQAVQSQFVQLAIKFGPAPPYPRAAEQRRIAGTVTLRIHVDASGNPLEVTIENSSGSPILDQAAQKFVKSRWRFVPAMQDGVPVEAWGLMPIEYVLD
jgi:protein TonB